MIQQCRKCGVDIYPDEKRCPHCGASLSWLRKLAPCRDCGELVSKTAPRCPYCGVRYPNRDWHFVQILSAIVLVLAVLWMISAADRIPLFPSSEDAYQEIEINAEDLWDTFKYDRTYAEAALDDKTLSLTGIIADITEQFMGYPCILLENGEDTIPDGIFVMFPEGFDVFQYSIGEEITVIGRCSPAIHLAGDDTNPTIFVHVEDPK